MKKIFIAITVVLIAVIAFIGCTFFKNAFVSSQGASVVAGALGHIVTNPFGPPVSSTCIGVTHPIVVTLDTTSFPGTDTAGTTGDAFGYFTLQANCTVNITGLTATPNYPAGQYSSINPPASNYYYYKGTTLLGSSLTGISNPAGYFQLSQGQTAIIAVKLDLTSQATDKQLQILLTVTADAGTATSPYAHYVKIVENICTNINAYIMGGDTSGEADAYPSRWANDVWGSSNGTQWCNLRTNQPTSTSVWSPRSAFGTGFLNNMLYVFGGTAAGNNGPAYYSDVWSSSNGIDWNEILTAAPWGARAYMASVVYDNKLWIINGDQPHSVASDVWSSPDGINWTEVSAHTPWGAYDNFSALSFDGKMWVIGVGNHGLPSNQVWWSTDGVTWTQVSSIPWPVRRFTTAVVSSGKIWVMGGDSNGYNNGNSLNDVWSSPDGINWTEDTSSALWSKRWGFGAFALNNAVWVTSGGAWHVCIPNDICSDLYSSTDGVNWNQILNPTPYIGRAFFGVIVR